MTDQCSRKIRFLVRWFTASLLVVSLAGCSLAAQSLAPGAGWVTPPPPTAPPTPAPPSNPPEPSSTAAPEPTQTSEPTLTPTATATPTPTLHPMNIQALRQTHYPGSPITIEQTLERGSNYSRYYAYYLSEGLRIYGLLTIPDGNPPEAGWPSIVFNHGYIPPRQYRTTERYLEYVNWLARSGYIVFRIDYRGHDRSEGTPTGAYGDTGYTADVLNAVTALQLFPEANPDRIGMWGHSMGGYLTLRAMVISPDIKAGVIWAGVVAPYADLLNNWRRSPGPTPTPGATPSWRRLWTEQFGTPEDNPAFWDSISSNSYLNEVSGPIQLHHATGDESVPVEFSHILNAQLQAAGKPVELYIYEGDDHNLSLSFAQAMTRTIAFFDLYLKE